MLMLLLWTNKLHGQGGGDHCFWAFVCCGEFSSSAHPITKKKANQKKPLKKLFIIPFLCHIYSLPPSLMGVMWMFAASRLLVCDACCGLSVGTFKSVPLAAVEPQNKRA